MEPLELEIFRTGTHTSDRGYELSATEADLQEVATNYDPSRFKAPLIITHNTQGVKDVDLAEHPELAYGTPEKLKVEGGKLKAVFTKYVPKVKEWFDRGQLLGVSSSFYLRNSPNNPTPGKLALRHVAALGKTPPAVKGLAHPSFSEDELTLSFGECEGAEEFTIELNEQAETATETAAGTIEATDETLPDRVAALEGKIASLTTRDLSEMETTLTEAEQALARERQALADQKAQLDRREYLAFCEHDLRGKLTPAIASAETIVELMECLNNTTVEFSEGAERPIDKFKALLQNLPTQVEFGEVATGEIPDGEPEFKEPTKPAWQVARENAWKAAE